MLKEIFEVLAIFVVLCFVLVLITLGITTLVDGLPDAGELGENFRHLTTAPSRFWRGFCPKKETKPPQPRSAVE